MLYIPQITILISTHLVYTQMTDHVYVSINRNYLLKYIIYILL